MFRYETKYKIKRVSWGDGNDVKVKLPDLKKIPGGSVVCHTPCYPFGEEPEKWDKHPQKRKKPATKSEE